MIGFDIGDRIKRVEALLRVDPTTNRYVEDELVKKDQTYVIADVQISGEGGWVKLEGCGDQKYNVVAFVSVPRDE